MAANPRHEPFVDHAGVLRDSKTGRAINGRAEDDEDEDDTLRAHAASLPPARFR